MLEHPKVQYLPPTSWWFFSKTQCSYNIHMVKLDHFQKVSRCKQKSLKPPPHVESELNNWGCFHCSYWVWFGHCPSPAISKSLRRGPRRNEVSQEVPPSGKQNVHWMSSFRVTLVNKINRLLLAKHVSNIHSTNWSSWASWPKKKHIPQLTTLMPTYINIIDQKSNISHYFTREVWPFLTIITASLPPSSSQGVFLKKVKFFEVCQIKSLRVDISWGWSLAHLEWYQEKLEETCWPVLLLTSKSQKHYKNTAKLQNIYILRCFEVGDITGIQFDLQWKFVVILESRMSKLEPFHQKKANSENHRFIRRCEYYGTLVLTPGV